MSEKGVGKLERYPGPKMRQEVLSFFKYLYFNTQPAPSAGLDHWLLHSESFRVPYRVFVDAPQKHFAETARACH
jgi:hypothetical protein